MDVTLINPWVLDFNKYIQNAVDQIRKDDYLKKIIAQLKLEMFNDNTHDWSPLRPSTIKRKKYLADEGLIPVANIEKINVRTGKLKSAFTNSTKVIVDSDFGIYFEYDDDISDKVMNARELGRDPEEFTEEEFAFILEYVANALSNKISEKYG